MYVPTFTFIIFLFPLVFLASLPQIHTSETLPMYISDEVETCEFIGTSEKHSRQLESFTTRYYTPSFFTVFTTENKKVGTYIPTFTFIIFLFSIVFLASPPQIHTSETLPYIISTTNYL